MQLYHGSEHVIKYPQPWLGRKSNDYGQGFYCTQSEQMACEWAVSRNADGFVNSYKLDINELNVLDLMNGEYNVLNWLAILLENRTFRLDNDISRQAKSYILEYFNVICDYADVIIGYRADDSYFAFASAFLNNTLSLTGLSKAMRLGNLGEQVFVKSRRAFGCLEYLNSKPVSAAEYYPAWFKRDENARRMYREMKSDVNKEVFVVDVIREKWGNDDERIQRIVRI